MSDGNNKAELEELDGWVAEVHASLDSTEDDANHAFGLPNELFFNSAVHLLRQLDQRLGWPQRESIIYNWGIGAFFILFRESNLQIHQSYSDPHRWFLIPSCDSFNVTDAAEFELLCGHFS